MAKPLARPARHPGNQAPAAKPADAPKKTVQPTQDKTNASQPKPPTVQQSTALAPVGGLAARFAKAAGKGATETMSSKDYAIPFLKIMDKNNSQSVESSENYIEGARPGMIWNTVTKELFDGKDGIEVVICGFKSVILEWESTEPGSGFIAEHPASSDIKQSSGAELVETAGGGKRLVIPENGHCLQDANNYYVIFIKPDGEREQDIISMTGSNLTVSRLLNSALANRKMEINGQRMKAPTYGVKYRLRSKATTDGQFHWHVWEFEDAGLVDDDGLFDQAESFYETVNEGRVKGNYDQTPADPAAGDSNADGDEDQIPFS